jgi:nitroreductase
MSSSAERQTDGADAAEREATLDVVLGTLRRRRVCRSYTSQPVGERELKLLLEAARWAPSAGNRRINKFLVVRDAEKIKLVRQVAPGMLGVPTALIVICTDRRRADEEGVKLDQDERNTWIDVGAAAQNVMLAAEALGLGSCPLTSFSLEGVRVILELPDHLVPDYVVQLGHRAPAPRQPVSPTRRRITVEDLSYWERVAHDI